MGRSRGLLLVAGLLAALLPAVVAAVGPQPGAPCEPTLLAAQVALFCAPGMATALCCEPVVLSVDLGVPCVCRVAAEPQLAMAGLDADHLLTLYSSCGGLRPGVAHLASSACEGPAPPAAVVSSLRPPAPASPARRPQTAHDAPPPLPPSSEKPSSPPPAQELDGAAPHGKAAPAQPSTSPLAPAAATAPPPLPRHSAATSSKAAFIFVATAMRPAPPATVVSSPPPSPPSPAPRCTKTARDAAPQPLSSEKPSSPPLSVDLDLGHEATSSHAPAAATTPPPHSAASSSQGSFIFVAHFATSPPLSSEKPPSSPLPSSKMPSPPPQQNGGVAQDDITPVELVFLVLGYVCTGALFLSPIPIISEIFTTGEVGLHKPDLFIITLVNCVVGLLYGVPDPIKLTPVIFNIVGILFQIVYLVVFFRSYAAEDRWKLSICVVWLTFAAGMIALCIFLLDDSPRRTFGIIGVVITTGMYAGPIRQVIAVWRTNNVAHMSFWVAGAAFLSGVFRTVYASLTHDWLNLGPYIVGAISGLGQLTLFIWVKFRYPQ